MAARLTAFQSQIANYIYGQSAQYGVNPNTALGIAASEGLLRSDPLASNPDGSSSYPTNIAVGPFQIGTTAAPSTLQGLFPAGNRDWQQQVDATLQEMGTNGYGAWNSVGDAGGLANITQRGANLAAANGITGADTTAVAPTAPTSPDPFGNYSPPFTSGLPGAFGDPNGVGGGMPPDLSMKPQGLDIGAVAGGLPKGIASVIPGASILGAGAAADPAGGQSFDSSGPPVEITNISAEGQIGQQAIAKQTAAVAQGETKAAQIEAQQQQTSTLADLTGWTKFVNSIEQSTTNLFIRGGLVLLAVALLFGAWMLLGGSKTVEKAALFA